jgi:hypothetical protein
MTAATALLLLLLLLLLSSLGGNRNPKDQQYMRMTLNQLLVELDGFKVRATHLRRQAGVCLLLLQPPVALLCRTFSSKCSSKLKLLSLSLYALRCAHSDTH